MAKRMVVITSEHDLSQTDSTGLFNNQPERRKQLIVELLRESGAEIQYVDRAHENLALSHRVHEPAFAAFLETAWPRWVELWGAVKDRPDFGTHTKAHSISCVCVCV